MPLARLVTTVAAPWDRAVADPPELAHQTLLVQRGDAEVIVREVGGVRADRWFPAPWPREFGTIAVAPAGDLVVFARRHPDPAWMGLSIGEGASAGRRGCLGDSCRGRERDAFLADRRGTAGF